MKYKFTLIILLLCTAFSNAQNITGIWRGYFASGMGFYKQEYKYEIQINQLKNKGLRGVTYSYRTTVFYGKASLQGIYMDKNKNLIIKEDSLMEVKMADKGEPCLMTCYLDYYKTGNTEVLEGTFTSINLTSKQDCGSGSVYLERVTESDFHKEDFLVKREKKATTTPFKKVIPKTTRPVAKSPAPLAKTTPKRTAPKTNTNPVKPKKDTVMAQQQPPLIKLTPDNAANNQEPVAPKKLPVPKIIQQRETRLVKTIITNSPDIKIELYDNGEIDDDTITVYHNNEIVAYKKRLSSEPITLNVKADVNDPYHEFVMYADNLGKIPPNTALMVLTTGGRRYELFLTSTEQKNAKVVIEFKAPGKDSK